MWYDRFMGVDWTAEERRTVEQGMADHPITSRRD
jgi:hypothetical protein